MVKVGDKIRSVTDCDFGISVGNIYVVENFFNMGDLCYVWFNDSNDRQRIRDFRHYELVTETPPATIQHEGYNYTRGEPVVPDWVKDGAWVVENETGDVMRLSVSNHAVKATNMNGQYKWYGSDQKIASVRFRPFTASDWKWGMWAEYEGEKVFVKGKIDGGVTASKPTNGYFFIPFDKLTPTTAP